MSVSASSLKRPASVASIIAEASFSRRLEWLLRIGIAMCFVGHGAFGVLRKEAWLPYFALVGLDGATGRILMPWIGLVDIAVGLAVLFHPIRALLAYGAVWCLWTALLRPLAGEGIWEAVERAGNYGLPMALLLFAGLPRSSAAWLERMRISSPTPARLSAVLRVLQATTVLLLAGHGALLLGGKPLFLEHWAALGLPATAARGIGLAEICLAGAVLLRPSITLYGGVALWKMASEALFPLSGAPLWEWIERGGSYAAPAAAMLISAQFAAARTTSAAPFRLGGRLRRVAIWHAAPLLLLMPAVAQAQIIRPDESVLEQLRAGGFVLACRHAITNHDQQDRNVDFDDPRTQRTLSEAGEQQARELGEVLRSLRIPIGDVLASPFQRTRRSAELMFGRADVETALQYAGSRQRRSDLLGSDVPEGTNRVLMTHQGILYENLAVERRSIGEGDCVIVKPRAGEFIVLAQARLEDWRLLLER